MSITIPQGSIGVFSVCAYPYYAGDEELVLFSIVFSDGFGEDFQENMIEEACSKASKSKIKAMAREGDIPGRSKYVIMDTKRAKKAGSFLTKKGFYHLHLEQA